MRALTLHRPYPWAILVGRWPGRRKDVENRGFRPSGAMLEERLALHCGREYSETAAGAVDAILGLDAAPGDGQGGVTNAPMAIVGTVRVEGWVEVEHLAGRALVRDHAGVSLQEARSRAESPWVVPRRGGGSVILWLLADPRPLSTAVVCPGKLGPWKVPENVADMVRTYEVVPGG